MGHLILMGFGRLSQLPSKKGGVEVPKLNSAWESLPLSAPRFIKVSELISKLLFTFVFLSANPQKENKLDGLVPSSLPIKNLKHYYLEVKFKQNFKLNQNVRVKDHQCNELCCTALYLRCCRRTCSSPIWGARTQTLMLLRTGSVLRGICKTQNPSQQRPAPHGSLLSRNPGTGDGFFRKIPVGAGGGSDFGVCGSWQCLGDVLSPGWQGCLEKLAAEPRVWGLSAGKAPQHSQLCSANSAALLCSE